MKKKKKKQKSILEEYRLYQQKVAILYRKFKSIDTVVLPEFWTPFIDFIPEVFTKVMEGQLKKIKQRTGVKAELVKKETLSFMQAFVVHCSGGLTFFKHYVARISQQFQELDMKEAILQAKKGDEQLLFRILATDRFWFLDSWVKAKIAKKLKMADSNFFIQLGKAIQNKNDKVRTVPVRSESLKYLKKIKGSDGSVLDKKCALPDSRDVEDEILKNFIGRRPKTNARSWDELSDEVDSMINTKQSVASDALRKSYEYNNGIMFCDSSISKLLNLMKAYHFPLAPKASILV